MARRSTGIASEIDVYLDAHSPENAVVEKLRRETAPLKWARMQIAPSQAAYLSWLVRTMGARRTIEVGVFTGMSSLVTALALPSDGRILACDVNEEWTTMARAHFAEAGVAHKVDLVLQPATETLEQRLREGEVNSYDFAFIDADKESYDAYYELCLRLVRRGGVIMLDNMLWGGTVADKTEQSPVTKILRRLNTKIISDKRVAASLVPIGDGLMLATKL